MAQTTPRDILGRDSALAEHLVQCTEFCADTLKNMLNRAGKLPKSKSAHL